MKRQTSSWGWIVAAVVILGGVAVCGLGFIGMVTGVDGASGQRIALIELNGEITDSGGGGPFNHTSGARDFIDNIEAAKNDASIKAVVIRINSPGGSASASQEMYHAVRGLGKPVICSMGDLAASGGYYVASACDTIYADGSTLTGSIGVISQFLNYEGLFKKLGLDTATIKSGKFKDAGNPARQLTPEERQLFQTMIMSVYTQFVDDVAAGRKGKLTRAQVLKLADGRVYTGVQAKANGLIDKIGGLQEAIAAAGVLAGIQGKPKIKTYSGGGGLGSLLGADSQAGGALASDMSGGVDAVGSAFGEAAARGFLAQVRHGLGADGSPSLPRAEVYSAR